MIRPHSAMLPVFLVTLIAAIVWMATVAMGAPGDRTFPPVAKTVLRVARSTDGLTFRDTGEVFMKHAAAPDLEVVGGHEVLALFDSAESNSDRPCLSASRSRDGGVSWSSRRPIRIKGLRGERFSARRGDLVRVGRRKWRIYFAGELDRHASRRRETHIIRSAITRNGADYVLDRRLRLLAETTGDPSVMAVSYRGRVHLYFEEARRSSSSTGEGIGDEVRHLISRGGNHFASLRPVDVTGALFAGSVVPLSKGMRAYVTSKVGIVSFVSADGRQWVREPGIRLCRAWDPAVARLANGSYLMLYCDALNEASPSEAVLVEALPGEPEVWPLLSPDDEETVEAPEQAAVDTQADGVAKEAQADVEGLPEKGGAAHPIAITENREVPAGDASGGVSDRAVAAEESDEILVDDFDAPSEDGSTWIDQWDPESSEGYAPAPDFDTRIDYFEWFREFEAEQPEENAYDAYAALVNEMKEMPTWPDIKDMFNGDYEGPPIPWSAKEHPEWEASYQAMRGFLEKYRKATEMPDYALRIEISKEDQKDFPGRQPLLIGLRLPHLQRHRELARSNLAAAWRVGEDGKVSPRRMLDAWRTILRGAAHLNQGSTLIEDLVGLGERWMVDRTARYALQRGVFSGDELQAAFDTLRRYDRAASAMPRSMRGEHALAMDVMQYMFAPKKRGDPPQAHRDRITAVVEGGGTDSGVGDYQQDIDLMAAMGPQEVRETIQAFDAHYRELEVQTSIGYPDVRAADLEAARQRYTHGDRAREVLLPAMARAYQLHAREEASRRATQLAYATQIFKERNGRWPASLDELPAEFGETMRIDPFSGEPFGYRVTEDGPVIYTVSENGVDDGGVNAPRWSDHVDEATGSDDHIFWPLQPR